MIISTRRWEEEEMPCGTRRGRESREATGKKRSHRVFHSRIGSSSSRLLLLFGIIPGWSLYS